MSDHPEVRKATSEPEALTPRADPPADEHFKSRLCFRIGRRRYEMRIAIKAREIVTGPADVIEIRPSAKRNTNAELASGATNAEPGE